MTPVSGALIELRLVIVTFSEYLDICTASDEKVLSNRRKLCKFRSSIACVKYMPSSQTLFSNDSVSEQGRPWSDCAYDAKTHFRLVRPKILFSTLHANSLLFRKQSFIFKQVSQEKKIDKYFRKPSAETVIQHAIPSGLFYPKSLDPFIPKRRNIWVFLVSPCFIEITVFNANSVDPDQTPRSAASDLCLHFLPVSLLWDARHKWVMIKSVVVGLKTLSPLTVINLCTWSEYSVSTYYGLIGQDKTLFSTNEKKYVVVLIRRASPMRF